MAAEVSRRNRDPAIQINKNDGKNDSTKHHIDQNSNHNPKKASEIWPINNKVIEGKKPTEDKSMGNGAVNTWAGAKRTSHPWKVVVWTPTPELYVPPRKSRQNALKASDCRLICKYVGWRKAGDRWEG